MKRETWVDSVKALACILVVLGHFFQSMMHSGIIKPSMAYDFFIQTIYLFHVQLFFICSGYLYQKYAKVRSFKEWKNNSLKKLIALGVPYFVFSLITWGTKQGISSYVNKETGGLFDSLFLHPLSPYWYLYVLLFIFIFSFTVSNTKELSFLLTLAVFLKALSILQFRSEIYLIDNIANTYIWFVLGITIAYLNILNNTNMVFSIILLSLFTVGSILKSLKIIDFIGFNFVLGVLACYSIISIVQKYSTSNNFDSCYAVYTLPIYLMHTIFAASLRIFLFKVGIRNTWIHIFLGITISFIGPVVAMKLLQALHPLDFIVYPSKYIKNSSSEKMQILSKL